MTTLLLIMLFWSDGLNLIKLASFWLTLAFLLTRIYVHDINISFATIATLITHKEITHRETRFQFCTSQKLIVLIV